MSYRLDKVVVSLIELRRHHGSCRVCQQDFVLPHILEVLSKPSVRQVGGLNETAGDFLSQTLAHAFAWVIPRDSQGRTHDEVCADESCPVRTSTAERVADAARVLMGVRE